MDTLQHAPARADVVVVGAGFAGLIAAREIAATGRSVLVIEGRERIGGRAYCEQALGRRLEFGGGWVHWFQPHVWAEMTRYGIAAVDAEQHPVDAAWMVDGAYRRASYDRMIEIAGRGMRGITADSERVFPYPYSPLHEPAATTDDARSVAEALDALGERIGLDGDERAVTHGLWQLDCHGPIGDVALTQVQRWTALAGHDWEQTSDASGRFVFAGGSGELVSAIADESRASLLLGAHVVAIRDNAPVVAIRDGAAPAATPDGAVGAAAGAAGADDEDAITIELADGSRIATGACIVTAPLNTLRGIEFSPELPEQLREVAAIGQASRGSKCWFRVRGSARPFMAIAPGDDAVNAIWWQYSTDDGFIGVAFAADGERHRPDDAAWVAGALAAYDPELELLEVAGHDWLADPFSRGTWAMLRPGQLARVQTAQQPFGRVIVAGADYATGWAGFFDGAIQEGYRAARHVIGR